jgi:hypothetical protein
MEDPLEGEVLDHCQVIVHARRLSRVPDQLADGAGLADDVEAGYLSRARARLRKGGQDAHGRGLA